MDELGLLCAGDGAVLHLAVSRRPGAHRPAADSGLRDRIVPRRAGRPAWGDGAPHRAVVGPAALNEVVCAPLGVYLRHFAWTKDLTGVAQGPLPFFWVIV